MKAARNLALEAIDAANNDGVCLSDATSAWDYAEGAVWDNGGDCEGLISRVARIARSMARQS